MNEVLYPKSLQEVWRWRENASRELQNLSSKDRVAYIHRISEKVLLDHGMILRRINLRNIEK